MKNLSYFTKYASFSKKLLSEVSISEDVEIETFKYKDYYGYGTYIVIDREATEKEKEKFKLKEIGYCDFCDEEEIKDKMINYHKDLYSCRNRACLEDLDENSNYDSNLEYSYYDYYSDADPGL